MPLLDNETFRNRIEPYLGAGLGGRISFGQSCDLHSPLGEDRGEQAHAGILFSY